MRLELAKTMVRTEYADGWMNDNDKRPRRDDYHYYYYYLMATSSSSSLGQQTHLMLTVFVLTLLLIAGIEFVCFHPTKSISVTAVTSVFLCDDMQASRAIVYIISDTYV